MTLRSKKIRIKWLWPVKVTLKVIKRGLLVFCWSCDEGHLTWDKKKLPSLQFAITDRMSLISPLNSNDRSIPLNVVLSAGVFNSTCARIYRPSFRSRKQAQNARFGLVFAKTGFINSGTGVWLVDRKLGLFFDLT